MILNVNVQNKKLQNKWSKKLIVLTREIDKSTIIVGDLNTSLSIIDQAITQKISKDIEELKNTINQKDLIDISEIFHLTRAEYKLFSSAHRKCINIYSLGCKYLIYLVFQCLIEYVIKHSVWCFLCRKNFNHWWFLTAVEFLNFLFLIEKYLMLCFLIHLSISPKFSNSYYYNIIPHVPLLFFIFEVTKVMCFYSFLILIFEHFLLFLINTAGKLSCFSVFNHLYHFSFCFASFRSFLPLSWTTPKTKNIYIS